MAHTIADKLSLLQNTKECIRQAIIDKGVEVSEADTFASYPEKIAAISSGGGDVVTAVNHSGAEIKGGQKVWLNKDAPVSQSCVQWGNAGGFGSGGWQQLLMDMNGKVVMYSYYPHLYVRNNRTGEVTNYSSSSGDYYNWCNSVCDYGYPMRCDDNGNVFVRNWKIDEHSTASVGMTMLSNGYATSTAVSNSRISVYRLNDKYEVEKTFVFVRPSGGNGNINCVVKGDYFYYMENPSNFKNYFYGKFDDNLEEITMANVTSVTSLSYGLIPADFTKDNNLLVCFVNDSSGLPYYGIRFYQVDEGRFTSFTSSNGVLNSISGEKIFGTFNRQSGVLAVCTNNTGYYVFKYDQSLGDFRTVDLVLEGDIQFPYSYNTFSIDTNMEYCQYGNNIFTLAKVGSDKYLAKLYSNAMGEDTLTGVANSSADIGAEFEAITILPEEG